jgi:hypothetical protein
VAQLASLPGPAFMLAVKNATHVDAECPTSRAADWICGQSDPARREVFERYLLASLQPAKVGVGIQSPANYPPPDEHSGRTAMARLAG